MPGKPSADRPFCRETTAKGKPCGNRAAAGSHLCASHGGGKRKPGRPSKLTEATALAVCDAVRYGLTLDIAAQAAGVNVATLHGWRTRGEEDLEHGRDTPFARFVEDFTRAQAEGEVNLVQSIRAHVLVDWRAGAWLLERRAPDRWSSKRRDNIDPAVAERAEPRVVTPDDPTRRDTILAILSSATQPPAGYDPGVENTP